MISKWILKAIVQKTISFLPYSQQINYFFQKYVTKGVVLSDAYFEDRLGHARTHILAYEANAAGIPLRNTLELGAGWYPVVPLALYLHGAEKIRTVDVTLLTNTKHIRTTIGKFLEYADQGKLSSYLTCRPERLQQLRVLTETAETLDFATLTAALNIEYIIQDARRLNLPDGDIDLIHSNNTFEHIYPHILRDILLEFKRVARPGGIQSHFIDLSDHFAHFDTSITIYNFLRFSPRAWRFIDNSVQPMSRLRMPEYRHLYQQAGLPITSEELRPGSLQDLRRVPVHTCFRENSEAELAISHGHILSVMP